MINAACLLFGALLAGVVTGARGWKWYQSALLCVAIGLIAMGSRS